MVGLFSFSLFCSSYSLSLSFLLLFFFMLLGWLGLVGLVRTKVSPFFYIAPPSLSFLRPSWDFKF